MAQTPPAAPILESQGVTVSLAGTPDLDGFVAAANAGARIKGLDDALNPGILDAAKLRAMVATLPAQPEAVRAALAGHALIVGAPGTGVLAIEPTRADAFGPAYRLTVERLAGVHVLATGNPRSTRRWRAPAPPPPKPPPRWRTRPCWLPSRAMATPTGWIEAACAGAAPRRPGGGNSWPAPGSWPLPVTETPPGRCGRLRRRQRRTTCHQGRGSEPGTRATRAFGATGRWTP